MEIYDVVVIGAGHNGLVCAAYLLKAGYRVLLLEKRSIPGGAATTEELMPKEAPHFQFNRCAIDHEFIFLGPVLQELGLAQYGLEYLFCDPTVFCPHPNGQYFLAHRSLAQTCAEIARYSPRDAEKYGEFIRYWSVLMEAIQPLFNVPPQAILEILGSYDRRRLQQIWAIAGSKNKALDFIRTMISSPEDLLNEWFDSEIVKAPLARLAAEIGAPPSQKGITAGMMMMAMRHDPGMARPKGGTGALINALVKLVQAKGGTILTEQTVKRVLVDKGTAIAVEVADGKIFKAAKGIISNLDARRLFLQLVEPGAIAEADPHLRERVERRLINNNETILKIDCALAELPRFERFTQNESHLMGTILIADSMLHVEQSHALTILGQIPDSNPSLYLDIPTLLDPSMAPPGKHTLWIEFFAPYQIAGAEGTGLNGTGWTEELKNKVADRVIDKLADYAPNLKAAILARHVESPAELAERLGSYKGNYYHLDMTLDQMMFLRPLPEIANYQTPIKNLYLTGAGTHPGGSISGMPGRNCARVFLKQQRSWLRPFRALG
ncbi:MAG: NAD(P)/FAD-dependent oxidoreductase [Woronichinia naegeliana WA131]|jgi:beta-carotene ketolase (CrtO type)|uniref:Pyridine nucleotide-disulfide oxidoreductase domain-containing protein 2 n=1 Tax=Woronichinia naegeliana WA131 TaxID=2824559 RepID=A0A977PUG1_9CYAN|nr:MAG: NAD(P)/FAD-dependent oxidoreductase [Woronichinia naegeliana WA131]